MASKDISEKQLISLKDIFADIINVYLFNGKRIMDENDLEDVELSSFYEYENETREQVRDVAKAWVKNHVRIAILGIENRTVPDKDMVLRCIGYDGAAYRNQIKNGESGNERYPVVTLVLYFGKTPWNAPTTLFERIKVPEELKPFVNDYKINLIEMRNVTQEQVSLFKSDFKEVAKYYYEKRVHKHYKADFKTLTHVKEILSTLSEITNEEEFDSIVDCVKKGDGGMGSYYMSILDGARQEGRKEGILEGERRGILEGKLEGIKSTIEQMFSCGLITQEAYNKAKQMNFA